MGTLTPSVSPALPAAQGHSGWNKVALLTAVRNSPCSCPLSVSLTRPQDALNSEPLRGSLWDVPYKLTYSLPVEGGGFCEAKAGGS